MSKPSINWKEKIVTKKLFDDEMEINVTHRALYDESGTELIWDRVVMEALLRVFFREYPDAVLDVKIDFKAGVHWRTNICDALIFAQIVKYLFNDEVKEPFVHLEDIEEDRTGYLNLVHGESENIFYDNICKIMEHLNIDLTKFKEWLMPSFDEEDEEI